MARKVIITNDESESFKRSICDCEFCDTMHASVKEWDTFTPKTVLQKNIMKVVKRIEEREKKDEVVV